MTVAEKCCRWDIHTPEDITRESAHEIWVIEEYFSCCGIWVIKDMAQDEAWIRRHEKLRRDSKRKPSVRVRKYVPSQEETT